MEVGILARAMADLERSWRAGVEPVFERLGVPLAPATVDPWLVRSDHGEPFRWLHGEFTAVRRADPGATW